jgi:hypothetical protein
VLQQVPFKHQDYFSANKQLLQILSA